MKQRHLQTEDTFECHGKEVVIFQESDVPQAYKIGTTPPPKDPDTWAWAFTNSEDKTGEIECIYLGFATKDAAMDDAYDYRRDMMEDNIDE